jgi:hypothetical protein
LYSDQIDLHFHTPEILFDLLRISQTLELDRLEKICELHIIQRINLQNVVVTLKSAQLQKWKLIESHAISFVLHNYADVVSLKEFETLGPQVLVKNEFIFNNFYYF